VHPFPVEPAPALSWPRYFSHSERGLPRRAPSAPLPEGPGFSDASAGGPGTSGPGYALPA
jgi:hypothetical protein